MPDTLKPIKRVWKQKVPVPVPVPVHTKFDAYGNELPWVDVQEKNTASVSDTFEEMQVAETKKAATPKWWK
jgi:hypothetical protein